MTETWWAWIGEVTSFMGDENLIGASQSHSTAMQVIVVSSRGTCVTVKVAYPLAGNLTTDGLTDDMLMTPKVRSGGNLGRRKGREN